MLPDVLVVGGGNAALCAAMTAAESGARVLLLEGAPRPYRGGNSRHTRNFRCMHRGPLSVRTDSYTEDEYFDDLLKVTGGKTDEDLARLAIRTSEECLPWMQAHGVRFQPSLSGTLSLSRTNAFFLGGGKSLVNAYYRTAARLGVEVRYEAQVTHVHLEGGRVTHVEFTHGGEAHRVQPTAVVIASGGFQGDTDWLARAWGPAAKNFLIRGTPYNRGVVLKDLLDQGARSVGDPTQCHAVAIDGRAPKFDGGIVTRLDCVPFSVVVNRDAERFYDEGEDVWPKRYAIWGRLVAAQPDQVGYAVIDSRALELFMPSVFPAVHRERAFADGNLVQLANLCHNCRGCYYACQYTEPHEFRLNVPAALARVRQESWQEHAVPAALARAFQRSGAAIAVATVVGFALLIRAAKAIGGAGGEGFYAVLSHNAMVAIFMPAFLLPLVLIALSLRRYWRAIGGGPVRLEHLRWAFSQAATMRNLDGGHGDGCNFEDEDRYSNVRRWHHQAVLYGFLLCFAATSVATLMHYLLDMPAPYGLFSLPKLLGVPGGIALSLGTAGMVVLKLEAERGLGDTRVWGGEMAFVVLLFLVSTSGLALYAFGGTGAMPELLAFHLGAVLAFFLLTPYSKMVHGFFRLAALIREAQHLAPRPASETDGLPKALRT